MVGNQVRGHIQIIPKLTVTLHTFHQKIEDEKSLRLGQHLQPIGQGFQIDRGSGRGG
jgi:hypothetical protein